MLKVKAKLVAPKGCHISHLAHHVRPPTFLTSGQSNCSGRRPREVQPSRYNSMPFTRLVSVIVFSKRSSTGWCSFLQTPGPLALGTAEESLFCQPVSQQRYQQNKMMRAEACLASNIVGVTVSLPGRRRLKAMLSHHFENVKGRLIVGDLL